MGNKKKPTVPAKKQYDWVMAKEYEPRDNRVIMALSNHTPKRSFWVGYVEGGFFHGMISPTHPFPDTFPISYLWAFKTLNFDSERIK